MPSPLSSQIQPQDQFLAVHDLHARLSRWCRSLCRRWLPVCSGRARWEGLPQHCRDILPQLRLLVTHCLHGNQSSWGRRDCLPLALTQWGEWLTHYPTRVTGVSVATPPVATTTVCVPHHFPPDSIIRRCCLQSSLVCLSVLFTSQAGHSPLFKILYISFSSRLFLCCCSHIIITYLCLHRRYIKKAGCII